MQLKTPYIVMFLLIVVLGVYYPSLFIPFNSVDDTRMVNALLNVDHFSFKQIFLPGSSGYYYRPLLYATFVADKYLWGLHESFMHLENILLHALNVLLVFFVTLRLQNAAQSDSRSISMAAALLFALHPINTEAVNWISGRTDLLAASFVLLSLLLLLHALQQESWGSSLLTAFFFFVGCFAKETAIFFFPAALLIILFQDNVSLGNMAAIARSLRRRALLYLLFLTSCLGYLLVRWAALSGGDRGISHAAKGVVGSESNILYTLKVILKASGFYAKKLFYPFPLNFGIVTVPDYYIIAGILVLLVMVYLICRHDIIAALFVGVFLVGSSSFLVAISRMAWTPIAERYMYIPCALFSVAIVVTLVSLGRKMNFRQPLLMVPLVLYAATAYATVERNIIWQENLTLFQDTVKKSPNFETAKNDLAAALMEKGRKDEAFAVMSSMKLSSANGPYNELAVLNRVTVLLNQGDPMAARRLLKENFTEDTRLYEQFVVKYIAVEEACLKLSTKPNLQKELRLEVIELYKNLQTRTRNPFYLYRIGQMYLVMGNKEDARDYFARAYASAPDDAHYKTAAQKLSEKLRDQ